MNYEGAESSECWETPTYYVKLLVKQCKQYSITCADYIVYYIFTELDFGMIYCILQFTYNKTTVHIEDNVAFFTEQLVFLFHWSTVSFFF